NADDIERRAFAPEQPQQLRLFPKQRVEGAVVEPLERRRRNVEPAPVFVVGERTEPFGVPVHELLEREDAIPECGRFVMLLDPQKRRRDRVLRSEAKQKNSVGELCFSDPHGVVVFDTERIRSDLRAAAGLFPRRNMPPTIRASSSFDAGDVCSVTRPSRMASQMASASGSADTSEYVRP